MGPVAPLAHRSRGPTPRQRDSHEVSQAPPWLCEGRFPRSQGCRRQRNFSVSYDPQQGRGRPDADGGQWRRPRGAVSPGVSAVIA